MESPLGLNEREALSRFVANIIAEVDKVARLMESRNADAANLQAAQVLLKSTLDSLTSVERLEIRLQARISENL